MTIRCKFMVTGIAEPDYQGETPAKVVTLSTQYDPTIPEDQRFTKWTPTGTLTFTCTNPAVLAQLKCGDLYYLDLVPINQKN